MQAFARMYANVKATNSKLQSVAIDPASGGRNIIVYQPMDCVGTTDAGVEVPGTELHGLDMSFFYIFNEMGEIVSFHQQVESSMIEGVRSRVRSYVVMSNLGVAQVPASGTWERVGMQNVARVLSLNRVEQEVRGRQLNPVLLAKLSKDVASFYAPEISCSAGDKASRFSFTLTNVPAAECMQAFAAMCANVQATSWEVLNVAIDPASTGKTIVNYQHLDLIGSTDAGVHVHGTEMHAIDLTTLYTFNDVGKIVRFHQQVDSGLIEALARMAKQQEQSRVLLSTVQTGPWPLAQPVVFAVFAALGGLSGVIISRNVISRHDGPALLDHSY